MYDRVALVHYHEIGLKGRNRTTFERRLQDNLNAALVGLPVKRAERIASRIAVQVYEPQRAREIAERIALIPGVAYVAICYKAELSPESMEIVALKALTDVGHFGTFKVESKRSNTQYTEPTLVMNSRIGEHLRLATGAKVNLTKPDVTVSVIATQGEIYVSTERVEGIGGLPVGTAGRVISLLSAGIDSPVATWRMIRRGAVAIGIHFSGRPATSDQSERLVTDIGHVLERTGGLARIYVVPFGAIQHEISLNSPPDLRILLYRRLMLRVAESIAAVEKAKALITGESLGQVASQTLANIVAVDEAATMPILRPLIGSNKIEIIREAKTLGTYELSTHAHQDCCTLYMPRNPETHARLPEVLAAWAELDIDRMVDEALASIEWTDFDCHAYGPPKRWPDKHPSQAATLQAPPAE